MLQFYFAPVWQSFFTMLYLLFFLYFSIFYVGNLMLALKFLLYTIANSAQLLALGYLFWGVVFLIGLIIPFSLSVYAILLFFEIWTRNKWEIKHKLLFTALILTATPLLIVIIDEIIRVVASQDVLREFVIRNELLINGYY